MSGYSNDLVSFLSGGMAKNLDTSFLKGTDLAGLDLSKAQRSDAYVTNESGATSQPGLDPSLEAKLAPYRQYKVTKVGETSDKVYWGVMSPDGKRVTTSSAKDKENTFDKIMQSGAPMALLAGPLGFSAGLGGALGLSGAAASAAGGALINTAFSALNGTNPLRGIASAFVPAGLSAIPGFSGLPSLAQGAIGGGLSAAVGSKGDPRSALLGALLGGATPGMNAAGITSPVAQTLLKAFIRRKAGGG